jgi:predicted Zn finger-like uncharacterized protein
LRIRCERCSTIYELDPARLSPGGTPVQCTRCRHVFRAFPPGEGQAVLPLEPDAVGPSAPGDPRAGAAGPSGEPEKTAQYPAPAPSPARAAPPPAGSIVPGRKGVAPPRPVAPRRGSRSLGMVLVVLVVVAVAVAAWMALRGGGAG